MTAWEEEKSKHTVEVTWMKGYTEYSEKEVAVGRFR